MELPAPFKDRYVQPLGWGHIWLFKKSRLDTFQHLFIAFLDGRDISPNCGKVLCMGL